MKHRFSTVGVIVMLSVVALLSSSGGCSNEDKPLPEVAGVTVVLGTDTAETPDGSKTVVVSWNAATDERVDGYAIFRAEQPGDGTADERSEFTVQAVTFATKYVDDDVHATINHPMMRYFYQIAVLTKDGVLGPMSPEVSIDYSSSS